MLLCLSGGNEGVKAVCSNNSHIEKDIVDQLVSSDINIKVCEDSAHPSKAKRHLLD
jgi:hypothetical protein